ncbi:hypothetical protein MRB53_012493 [Persea americana]|uniref:Uncharacterized protein n=1 Tax=Persea americana TaxID=3435 RepID=A0ACC2LYS5_PERAE|nr:hypothetical protein MRB53_012493 [Persea americana]
MQCVAPFPFSFSSSSSLVFTLQSRRGCASEPVQAPNLLHPSPATEALYFYFSLGGETKATNPTPSLVIPRSSIFASDI